MSLDNDIRVISTRRTLATVGVLSTLLFAIFGGAVMLSTTLMKETLAERFSQQLRRFLIMGDNREAEYASAQMVPEVFTEIAYHDADGETTIRLPPRIGPSTIGTITKLRAGRIAVPVKLGDGAISGTLEFTYDRFANLELAACLWLFWLVASVPIGLRIRRGIELRLGQAREFRRLAAVAQTTQMLAHDIRRPFSIFSIAMAQLEGAGDMAEVQRQRHRFATELTTARQRAEGMLQDLMDNGRELKLSSDDVSLTRLLRDAMAQVFAHQRLDVAIESHHNHGLRLRVDRMRTERVIVNIVENAVQAMHGQGRLWLRSRKVEIDGKPQVELTIGNNGPTIASEDALRLFEPFFSKGKRDGSGLGLAIARKIISAQGGTIHCRSDDSTGVEFVLTLPAASAQDDEISEPIPPHAEAFLYDSSHGSKALATAMRPSADAIDLPALPRIAIVEDNLFVQDAWHEALHGGVTIDVFDAPSDFLARSERDPEWAKTLLCVITDLHFGPRSTMNGIGLIERLRSSLPDVRVILSTNDPPPDLTIQLRIGKEPMRLSELRTLLAAHA